MYNDGDSGINGAVKRNDWSNTKDLISKGVIIIPNSSKTEVEILEFNKELGINLPYISENGSVVNGLNEINSNLPEKID